MLSVVVCAVLLASAAALVWIDVKRVDRTATAIAALATSDARQRAAIDAFARGDRDWRHIELALLGASVAIAIAAVIGLARRPAALADGDPSSTRQQPVAEDAGSDRVASSTASHAEDLHGLSSSSPYPGQDAESTARLRTLVALCDATARAETFARLSPILTDAAAAIPAQGIVVWSAPVGAIDLRATLAHGYSADLVARLRPVPRTADNAAAVACRTGRVQIVRATDRETTGAIVAPLISVHGCVGCLAVEVAYGVDTSDSARMAVELLATAVAGRFGDTSAFGGSASPAPEVRTA